MHELVVAQQIVRAVLATMEQRGASAVRAVDVEIGELEGLRIETLRNAFLHEATGTPAEGATLNVTLARATGLCPSCDASRPVTMPWDPSHAPVPVPCPECGTELRLEGGRGLVVHRAAMVLEDP